MCVACVWDHSGGFSGVVYGKSSRVLGGSLGKSLGSPWGKPGERLGKESRLQDFEKNFLSLCVSYSSGRAFF